MTNGTRCLLGFGSGAGPCIRALKIPQNTTRNTTLQIHLHKKYESFCEIDVKRITRKREKKIASLRKAFEDDRIKPKKESLPKKRPIQQPNLSNEISEVFVPETQNITEENIDPSTNTNIVKSIPQTQETLELDPETTTNHSKNLETNQQTGRRKRKL